jgi:hypothetical protein
VLQPIHSKMQQLPQQPQGPPKPSLLRSGKWDSAPRYSRPEARFPSLVRMRLPKDYRAVSRLYSKAVAEPLAEVTPLAWEAVVVPQEWPLEAAALQAWRTGQTASPLARWVLAA